MSEVADYYRILAAQNRAQWLRDEHGDQALARAKKDVEEAHANGLRGEDLILLDWVVAALEGRL
ncbi:MAG: hypothetical protein JNJ73_10490 [Hyphomonadaceae bacterium]|nr:hypothetical protein [Hyphomonadaceae bacterium]